MRACLCLISNWEKPTEFGKAGREKPTEIWRFEEEEESKTKHSICRQLTDASSSKQCLWVRCNTINKGNCKSRPALRLFVVSLYRQYDVYSLLFYKISLSFYYFKSCNWILIFGISASTEEPFFFFTSLCYLFICNCVIFVRDILVWSRELGVWTKNQTTQFVLGV